MSNNYKNLNMIFYDEKEILILQKKVEIIGTWLSNPDNIHSALWSSKIQEQSLYQLRISTIKKRYETHPNVFQPRIIIHPQPKR